MAKASVIYLVAVVEVEERRRRKERGSGSGVIPSLSFRLGCGLSDEESQSISSSLQQEVSGASTADTL